MKTLLESRREFLRHATLATVPLLLDRSITAQSQVASVRVESCSAGEAISPDFIGLSYENMQIEDPTFFSARNTSLIEQFKAIAKRGVLRLGGNTSEFNWWKADPSQRPPVRDLVLKNGDRPQDTLYAITPQTIQNLDDFLKATGWRSSGGGEMAGCWQALWTCCVPYRRRIFSRARYVELLREMSVRLAGLQQPDGLWHTGLLNQSAYPLPEISGSAFFTYAMAWGVNEGLLDRATFGPVIRKPGPAW